MEMIIFMGAQAAGKSSFYKARFFHSHMRINLDMLKTRNRERILSDACLSASQPIVIDNTNPTPNDRLRYISRARESRSQADDFRIVGFYFQSSARECLARNKNRKSLQRVSDLAIRGTINRLELPRLDEGFSSLNFVQIKDDNFIVSEWNNDI